MATNKILEVRRISVEKKARARLVRQRAYEIYLKRIQDFTPGDADSDWIQAEKELMN